jgi:hypothetical protein
MFIDRHHITPKHQGGGDDEANLIHLPRWAHAEVHYRLWLVGGELSDLYAAQILGINLTQEEQEKIFIDQRARCARDSQLLSEGRRKSKKWKESLTTDEYKLKMKNSSERLNAEGKINSMESRRKSSETKRRQGNYNAKRISVDGVKWRHVNEYVRENPDSYTARQLRSKATSDKYPNIFYI